MMRRALLGLVGSALIFAGLASAASASSPIGLYLSQNAAFAILGHSCGGIQEHVYATGFAPNGYPEGNVFMSTRCGGSGRGGGYKTTEYTGTAAVVWTWFGETRSYSVPGGPLEATEATDSHGDRVYNVGNSAYLEDGTPPLQPPGAPTGITASVGLAESGETEFLRLTVGWTVDGETAGLLKESTITATPKAGGTPLVASFIPYFSSGHIDNVAPNTTYIVTVTSTDAEGTSAPSAAIEIKTPNSDGEAEKEHAPNTSSCERNSGTIKLSPGLTETPHLQTITIKGSFGECGGSFGPESGSYTEKLKSSEEMTCASLQSASLEPAVEAGSLSVKWAPSEEGKSTGSLLLPITEVPLTGLTGTLQGGPFSAPTAVSAATVSESFTGGPTCGLAEGKKKAKAVKSGVYSTSEVEFG